MSGDTMTCDVFIAGAGTGGVAAALAACRMGRTVVMTEPTDWIGGQLTQQAVPPDEHQFIEFCGRTASYQKFRAGVRRYYQSHYPLTETARYSKPFTQLLNPGNAGVGRLCHEPRVGLAVLEEMLAPYVAEGLLTVLLEHDVVSIAGDGDRLSSAAVRSRRDGSIREVCFSFALDATETGDLLPLSGAEYVTGSESAADTGEPHAAPVRRPLNMQGVTACFAVDYLPGEDHTIERPESYGFWRSYRPDFWPSELLSWTYVNPVDRKPREFPLFAGPGGRSLWLYRRILDRLNFREGAFASDITLVNWPQNDYFLGPVFGLSEAENMANAGAAKQLSLSLLYWMQTEAPRLDGGCGYRGLRLRPDVVGTKDGLAKHLYIRESRRICAETTVREQDIAAACRPGAGLAAPFADSIGVGHYRIDLHPTTGGDHYLDLETLPFQIPLGCLLPVRMENLLAAGKNIGTTHITNGCYRLHPIEWNVGEAAGALAAFCLERKLPPRGVRHSPADLNDFQNLLRRSGIELQWPDLDWSAP